MVDLLGRAGLLEEAKNLIDGMPFKPNDAIWGALLGACRTHCKSKLAEVAVKNLIEFDAEESGRYILLANIYFDSGKLESVADVRERNTKESWLLLDRGRKQGTCIHCR